jgi:hypothetical protein
VRILKTMSLCAMAVCAMAALVVPAASASWTKNGAPVGEFQQPYWTGGEGPASISGSFNFSGGASCENASGSVDFASNEVKGFAIPAAGCKTVGTLRSLGCTSVKSITSAAQPLFAPVISGSSRYVNVGVNLTYLFEGGAFCPKEVKISGVAKGTPDNFAQISSLTLSGNLSSSVAGISSAVTGTLNLAPVTQYGIKGTTQVALNGNFGFTYASCKASAGLGFGEGGLANIETFDWSECGGGGQFLGCAVTVTSKDLPWAVQNTGTTVKITNMKVTETVTGCAYKGSYNFSGPVTLTPDKASAISSTTGSGNLSGGLTGAVSGSLGWSPAGVYGL